jgi:predicted O-linked N-acetylglucosamine transferase (SPINDLY family)
VGYFSGDFHIHPVSTLSAELYELHDRSRFEVTAFSFGADSQHPMRQRLKNAFDRFVDVRSRSDEEVARLSREMGLDIAVDLGGFTGDTRFKIFALRAAPLQVSYLGYLGTTAAPYMDYLVADAVLVPRELRRHYTEKLLYLPSYQVNDTKRNIARRVFTRAELGLPESGFVYCCFNQNYKITPGSFSGWMRILEQVPGSVLLLYAGRGEEVQRNLRAEAKRRGVEPERLVFGEALPAAEYLARYRAADLFLDTLPYNAGTTASDALWAGLPVLTCMGEAFASRMAGSVLSAIGLPELITYSQAQYEEEAIALGRDPERLGSIKQRLAANRLSTALFDSRRFTENLERAYTHIYERFQAGLAPADIHPFEYIDSTR